MHKTSRSSTTYRPFEVKHEKGQRVLVLSHNPEVAGSSPAAATRKVPGMDHSGYFLLLFRGYKFGLSNTFLTHRPVKWSAAAAIC